MKRAYSTIVFKAVDDDERILEGIASTPATDRMEDIVEPMGAEFKLPLPLLWQHRHSEPIGWVEQVKATKDGITIRARIARAGVTQEIDRAWALIKEGLVRGLSIGFNPLEWSDIKGTYGLRFTKWDWLELSAVTIPANAEATITSVKQFDLQQRRAVSGDYARSKAISLSSPLPGVPGTTAAPETRSNTTMKKLSELIAQWEARIKAATVRQDELLDQADEATLNDEQQAEYDQLDGDIKEASAHLKRLKARQSREADDSTDATKEATKAADEPARRVPSRQITVKANLEPGVRFARYAMALKRSRGNLTDALNSTLANKHWMDQTPELAMVLRAAVAAGDTTTSGWASELVYAENLANEFIEYLRPMSIMGRISSWRRVPFNMRVGGQSAGSTGYWVGQGLPVPVSKLTTTSASLGIAKAAGLVAVDEELVRSSSPSAELLVRNDLAEAIVYLLDRSLIDPTQGGTSNVQPAALTYGLTPVTPTGTDYAAFKTDFTTLTADMITDNIDLSPSVWIMSASSAQKMSLMVTSLGVPQFPQMTPNGGTLLGYPVIVSQSAYFASGSPNYGHMIVFLNPREVFLADDGQVTIEISREASIQLLDNPTNASTGATVATTMVSMFQTQSEAIKAVRYVNWAKRRTNACAFIRNADYK
jgi:HK97 family phage major capsid protein/HK97 family phage prohead protease